MRYQQLLLYMLWLSLARGEDNSTLSADANTSSFSKEKERFVISRIPELPATVAKPGVLDSGVWLVLFYVPWCEYSQAALPHFVATVQHIVDHNITGLSIGKLDISKDQNIGRYFNIQSTPVISVIREGYRYNFDGKMSTENLIAWSVRIITANVTAVESREQMEALKKAHEVLFLLVHDGEIDTDWQSMYSKVCRELALRGTFLFTINPNILGTPPAKLPALLVLKEGTSFNYKGSLAGYALHRWILTERHVALPTATPDTFKQFIVSSDTRKLLVLAVDKDISQRRIAQKKAHEAVRKLAQSRRYHESFQFVLTEGKEVMELILRRAIDSFPQLVAYDIRKRKHIIYQPKEKGYAESAISEFLNLVQNSKLPFEGGPKLWERLEHLYRLFCSVIQATSARHPYTTAAAGLSVVGVVLFYTILACQNWSRRKIHRSSRQRARQAALTRHHDNNLRRRHRENHHNNSDRHDNSEDDSEHEETSKDK